MFDNMKLLGDLEKLLSYYSGSLTQPQHPSKSTEQLLYHHGKGETDLVGARSNFSRLLRGYGLPNLSCLLLRRNRPRSGAGFHRCKRWYHWRGQVVGGNFERGQVVVRWNLAWFRCADILITLVVGPGFLMSFWKYCITCCCCPWWNAEDVLRTGVSHQKADGVKVILIDHR